MADSSKTADDAIYNDDSNNYSYDQYQAESQWLYNDSQVLQMPQAETASTLNNAATSGAGDPAAEAGPRAISKDAGKLFVGGLSWETDEVKLRDYFSKYGSIMECSIMRDQVSGRPRGFGFVTFDDASGVDAVLKEPSHTLDGKVIDPKHAIPREQQPGQGGHSYGGHHGGNMGGQNANGPNSDPVNEMKGDKIFVGGLPPSATDADLNSSFAGFGNIIETKLMIDRETGRSRGYGFLQYDSETAALEAVKAGNTENGIMIHGKRVDVKPAVHKKRNPIMGGGMGMMGGAAGASGGYGMMGMGGGYGMMGMGMGGGYGMMGMQPYGMMNMPGYGMMGANGQSNGAMDYSAMGYSGYYGNMAGYYGVQGDGTTGVAGADGSSGANGYYGQAPMGAGGYYGGADGQGDGSGAAAQSGSDKNGYSNSKGGEQPASGYYGNGGYDQHGGSGANASSSGYGKSGRQSDDRHDGDRGNRDSGHRSSSRRHGSDRSGRERSRGDRGSNSRSNDDYRGQRSSRTGRDRDRDGPVRGSGGSSSRSHGYNPY